ncbi:MAG: TIGR00341 family protein [Verrucomicrobiota bacterium]
MSREQRLDLVQGLREGSRWSLNFGVLLGCSVLIAGLGLLQNSVAVIIGAMLVAPLMTPLIGLGLAMVQGNFDLFGVANRSMLLGAGLSLVLGLILQWLTPGDELTLEVSLRGEPNILDLFIAFFAGVAAGYAFARPTLSGALPGVAISVALVPPLAASGIALGAGDWQVAMGAMMLFLANMVAISLGSAMVFRLHGIRTSVAKDGSKVAMRKVIMLLGAVMILLMAPLGWRMFAQLRQGQAKPESFTLSEEMWFKLHDRLDREEGIDFITGVRASSERPEDVVILLSAGRPVPGNLIEELDEMIDRGIGNDLKVKFNIVQQGTVTDPEEAVGGADELSEPVINE